MSTRYHICVFDDDPFIAGLYARKFEERGWQVSVAEREGDVWKCLDDGATLLMVDIGIEDGGGQELVRTLRQSDSAHRHVPIVVLTELRDRDTVQDMMKQGVDAYLFKGHFVPNEAVEKVQRILDTRVL